MSLTLNSNLQTQLDGENRKPILEMISSPSTGSEIPFVGQKVHTVEDSPEASPDCFVHSSGSYVAVYQQVDDATHTQLYLKTSTVTRTTWNPPVFLTTTGSGIFNESPSCCELSTGNIGVVWSERVTAGTTALKWMVITTAGVVVTSGTISSTGTWYESSVKKLTDGADPTYILVAAQKNGSSWNLVKYTHVTGTWSAWSAGATLFTGTAATDERRNPFVQEIVLAGPVYQQWLLFDRVDSVSNAIKRKNVYWTKTAGTTKLTGALTVTALTGITDNYKAFEDPSCVRASGMAADTAYFAYVLRSSSILLSATSTPALNNNNAYFIWYDQANDWIIMADRGVTAGVRPLNGVYVINAVDLSIKKRYFNYMGTDDTTSTPRLHNNSGIVSAHYESPRLLVAYGGGGYTATFDTAVFDVIDLSADTVSGIWDSVTAEADIPEGGKRLSISIITVMASIYMESSKIWFIDSSVGSSSRYKMYSFDSAAGTEITIEPRNHGFLRSGSANIATRAGVISATGSFFWDRNTRSVFAAFGYTHTGAAPANENEAGNVLKFNIDQDGSAGSSSQEYEAAILIRYNYVTVTGFPKSGASCCWVDGGNLYIGIYLNQTVLPTASNPYGVGYSPVAGGGTFTEYHDAPFNDTTTGTTSVAIKPKGDGRLLVCTRRDGIGAYQAGAAPSDLADEIYSALNFPGWPTSAGKSVVCSDVAYDGGRNRVYAALAPQLFVDGAVGGIFIFDLDGDIIQPYYKIGSSLSTTPTFTADPGLPLVVTDQDYGLTICTNGAGNGVAAFWTRVVSSSDTDETDLIFDEELGSFDVLPYLTGRITTTQNLEHQPNRCEFEVANGGLFDPLNQRSLYRGILDFGRKIVIRKGERVSGVNYLVDAFTGYIESGNIKYARGSNKNRTVVLYDVSKQAFDGEITMSPPYGYEDFPLLDKPDGDFPSNQGILSDIAERLMRIDTDEISIGTFDNSQTGLKVQLTGMSAANMAEIVANRFQRVTYVNNSGLFTCKPINSAIAVSDTLPDHRLTFEMNPGENEGESTNRITVKGVSRNELTIPYPEELILPSMQGFVTLVYGSSWSQWYPYSQDLGIVATNPRIEIIYWESQGILPPVVSPFTADDVIQSGQYNHLLATMTASETAQFLNKRGVRLFKNAINNNATFQLSFTVNVFAQPEGTVAQEIQATADDVEHQQKMRGHIVERIVEFPLATTTSECQLMADWFMFRVKLSRRIVNLTMAGHLQHEPGDVIQFIHPESGDPLKGMIHEIRRDYGPEEDDVQTLTMGVFN